MAQRERHGRMKDIDLRPRLAFRVGVVGPRDVEETDARIGAAVDAFLAALRDEIAELVVDPATSRAYAERGAGEGAFDLTLVSSLAEGAERLVARRALKFGARLYAPAAFAQEAGIDELRASAAAFDLLSRAGRFALDGARGDGEAERESAERVGRFVVAHSDLVLAVWDGAARGRDGVGGVVAEAVRRGAPVWWIDAREDRPARLIAGVAELSNPLTAPRGSQAFAALAADLAALVPPPPAGAPERAGALGWLGGVVRTFVRPDWPPLDEFYAETPRPQRAVWSLDAEFLAWLAPEPARHVPAEYGAPGVWTDLYRFADRMAEDYGHRYRSSLVLGAALGVVALTASAFGGEADPVLQWALALLALLALAGVLGLAVVNSAWRWRERWLSYRALAERARGQRLLALVGETPAREASDSGEGVRPRAAWIGWLFAAHRRAAPAPTGAMAEAKREALVEALRMADERIVAHETAVARMRGADRRLRQIRDALALLTAALVVAKLGLLQAGLYAAVWQLVFSTAAMAALALAAAGLRVAGRFARSAQASETRLAALHAARDSLQALSAGAIDASGGSAHLARALRLLTAPEPDPPFDA